MLISLETVVLGSLLSREPTSWTAIFSKKRFWKACFLGSGLLGIDLLRNSASWGLLLEKHSSLQADFVGS